MKKKDIETQKRTEFLNIYCVDFNGWLSSIGFRSATFQESMSLECYHYEHYKKHVDALFGVEKYLHDALKISIVFLRDKSAHKFLFVGKLGSYSETYSIEEAKALILDFVKKERDKKQEELNQLANI